jgi:Ca2+-binding EF-hand superfamily protein
MSVIWHRKISTIFRLLDFDHDGIIAKEDFDRMAEGLWAQRKNDPAFQEEVRRIFDELWLRQTGSTKTNVNELMTEAVMVDNLLKQKNDPKLKATFRDFCVVFFASIETRREGYLQREEYRKALGNFGLPDARLADHIFKVTDVNHDGEMSLDEATRALVEFMFYEGEDSPYNCLWGFLAEA